MSNSKVLAIYKQLLTVAKRIPEDKKRMNAVNEIRTKFRENLANPNQENVKELLTLAESKLGYLKIITPKGHRNKGGRESFIVKDGKIVEGTTVINGRTIRSGIDPDDLARHQRLMRRQYFMDRK